MFTGSQLIVATLHLSKRYTYMSKVTQACEKSTVKESALAWRCRFWHAGENRLCFYGCIENVSVFSMYMSMPLLKSAGAVAVCCSVLQCWVNISFSALASVCWGCCSVLLYVAVHCSVLHCVAFLNQHLCSVLQSVVCLSQHSFLYTCLRVMGLLQCVAVCFSVF